MISEKYLNEVLKCLFAALPSSKVEFDRINRNYPRNLNSYKKANNMVLLLRSIEDAGLTDKIIGVWANKPKLTKKEAAAILPAPKHRDPVKVAASRIKITPPLYNIALDEDTMELLRRAS